MNQLLLLSDVSKTLDVKPYQITYLFTSRKIPDTARLGTRRVFTKDDCVRVAAALGLIWRDMA
ncbi:MAG: hypothetical protein WCO71_08295 [Pseudomonadota bacterium]